MDESAESWTRRRGEVVNLTLGETVNLTLEIEMNKSNAVFS